MADKNFYEEARQQNIKSKNEQQALDERVRRFQRARDSIQNPEEQKILEEGRNDQALQVLERNNFTKPQEILDLREDWLSYKDQPAQDEIELPRRNVITPNSPLGAGEAAGIATGAVLGAAGGINYLRNREYNRFKSEAEKYAKEKVESWKNNPDHEFAKSEQGAYKRARNEFHDQKLQENHEKASSWASRHNDAELQKAIKRKQIFERPNPARDTSPSRGYSSYMQGRIPRKKRRRGGAVAGASKSVAKSAAKKGAKKLAATLFTNPLFWVVVGVFAAIGFIVFIIFAIRAACDDPLGNTDLFVIGRVTGICELNFEVGGLPENPVGITTEKEGPARVANGEPIEYTLKVTYDPSALNVPDLNDLYVFDVVLFESTHVDATEPYARQKESESTVYYQWKLSDFITETPTSETTIVLKLTVRPVIQDDQAINVIYVGTEYTPVEVVFTGGLIGGEESGPLVSTGSEPKACGSRDQNDIWYGADCLPTNRYCGGKYNPRIDETIEWLSGFPNEKPAGSGGNFGDPLCSYRKAKADQIIDELEANQNRANFWKDIVSCEGGVNSYGRQVHPTTGRPWGPAGMFQMNIGRPIFSRWSPSGSLLRGDVPWQRQIQNAIRYNNNLRTANNDFGFWGSAMCLCWWPEYRTKGYCADIIRKGPDSDTGPRAPATNCPTGTGLTCNTAVRCENNYCNDIGRRGPIQ